MLTILISSLPLALTFLRILLSFTLFPLRNHLTALNIILPLACITDFLDGYLARKLNAITYLGQIMDPVADKLFMSCVLLCLCFKSQISILMFVLFLFKDAILVIGFLFSKISLPPLFLSKLATAIEFIGLFLVMNNQLFDPTKTLYVNFSYLGHYLLTLSLILGYVSTFFYVRMALVRLG